MNQDGHRGPTCTATVRADAGQGPGQGAARTRCVVLRAEVGRLPGAGVPRRRQGRHAVPQRQGIRPLLSRARECAARRAGAALCARRRDRRPAGDRRPHPAGLGVAVATHPSRSQPHQDARRADTGALHRFRRAGYRRHVASERAVPDPSRSAVRSGERKAVVPRHPDHRGPRARRQVAGHVRGRRPRRGDREETGRAVSAGQARDGQGQARPRRRLRRHRLPHPQERRGRRVDPARPVPRRRRAPDGRRRSVVHRQRPAQAAGRPRAAAQGRRIRRR